jgi:hypothetical protein
MATPDETPDEAYPSIESVDLSELSDLRWPDMDAEGAKHLAEKLATNTSLTWVNLEWGRIGCDGAVALAGALATTTTLVMMALRPLL